MKTLTKLLASRRFVGRVEWMGIAAVARGPVQLQNSIELVADAGIENEHHFRTNSRSQRQVTLIQHEHLAVVASLLNRQDVDPALLRRNIVVSGINLAGLRTQQFSIGGAILKGTGDCVPCSLMEEALGCGGYAAMIGHGGITCVVVAGGTVNRGDSVEHITSTDVQ